MQGDDYNNGDDGGNLTEESNSDNNVNLWGESEEKAEESGPEIEANDKEYRDQSVPDKPDGYAVNEKISSAADFDEEMFTSVQGVAHSGQMNQGTFTKLVEWHNKNVGMLHKGNVDSYKESFARFADRVGLSDRQVQTLTGWFDGRKKAQEKRMAQMVEFARRTHGKKGDMARLAEIDRIKMSKAYRTKGVTLQERNAHKAAVARMQKLCQMG